MRSINRKWWLAVLAVLLLMPVASAKPNHKPKKQFVPEGGSALVYVLGAGMTCLGAIAVRARSPRPKQL